MALSGTVGSYQEFNYTGSVQSIKVPVDGIYKLEVWGGCSFLENSVMSPQWGARGGYSVGYKKLKKNDVLYVCCGGAALGKYHVAPGTYAGGYNGGGSFTTNRNDCLTSGGGGATHISLNSNRGVLKNYSSNRNEILIVAGGGGGCGCSNPTGTGGGTNGGNGTGGYGGTQTTGYAFGQGGNSGTGVDPAGGGGGWYGGYGSGTGSSAGGGSGYIGGVPSFTYNNTTYSPSTSNGQWANHGKAKITFVVLCKIFNMKWDNKEVNRAFLDGVELEQICFDGVPVFGNP